MAAATPIRDLFSSFLLTELFKGMALTGKYMFSRKITVQYPEERSVLPENYRNFPFLVFDGDDAQAGLRCVACQICEKECPPQCIYIEKSKDKKPDASGKLQLYPAIFDIDTSVCMSCQICVEVCPFDAIKMDQVFEIATTNRFEALLLDRTQLAKPNSYYHEIHPTEATEVDVRLAAEKLAKAAAASKTASAAQPKPGAASSPPPTPNPTAQPLATPSVEAQKPPTPA